MKGVGVGREKRFASDLDDEKRRDQERKALRLLAELEQHEGEVGKATLVGFEQMSGLVGRESARSRVEEAFSALPWSRTSHATFDDFRATGLREVLAHLSDRTLRKATLAAADREIANRVAAPRPAPAASTAGATMWRVAERRAATLYRHAQDNGEVASDDPVVDEALARCGSGHPLAASVRAQMERELGISLARVRVHTDSIAAAAAKAVRAHAFTVGEDIFFAEGTYAPDSREGRKLLAHELTHVAQAHQGRTSTGGSGVRISEPGEALEREADAVAERVMQAPRAPKRGASMRAASPKARYTPAPSRASSLLLRKAAAKKQTPIADDTPFKEVGQHGNKTTWRLGDDDVFVCVSGPDGKPLETTVTVSADRNPERWNALGKKWAAAAPGRTWPRPAQGRTAPKSSSAPTDSTPMPATPPTPGAAGTPPGIEMDLGSALETVPWLRGLTGDLVGIPTNSSDRVYLDLHPLDPHATISAPTLHLTGLYVSKVYTGNAAFAGLVINANPTEATVTFSIATFDRALVVAGGKDIVVGNITLKGGTVWAANGALFGADVRFTEARMTGIRYPGAPLADLVLTNSSLFAFADSFKTLTTTTPGEEPGKLPTVPKLPPLAGTRVKVKLDGLGGSYGAGPNAKTLGSFTHFEAQLVKDATGQSTVPAEPLASITIDGARVFRDASKLDGGVKRVVVTGSADFVLALLDSPTVRAQKDVADVIDQLTKAGIVPTAGTRITLENVQLGASGSTASARTDIILDFDVPGSLKLHIELRGVAMSGDLNAQTGHVDFGKLFAVLSDGKGPIAALIAEGTADKGDKQLAGAIRHLEASGDVSRITTAVRSVKLPPKVDAVLAAVKKQVSTQGALDIDVAIETGADGKSELRGNAHARLEVDGVGSVDLSVVNFHGDADAKTKSSGSLAFDRFEAHLTPKASANRKATGDAAALIITGAHAATASGRIPQHASADMIDLRGDAGKSTKMIDAIHRKVASLPPVLQQAVKVVRTLDLGAATALAPSSSAAPASDPLPDANVTSNAHVALVIPQLGTIDATVRGFSGSTLKGSVFGDFETFEVSLLTTGGKRAARLVIRGGHGWIDPGGGKTSSPGDLNAQLDDVVIEGNSRGLLQALDNHAGLFASAPASIRTGFEFLRAHRKSLASTVNARATDLAVARIDGQTDATAGTIAARIAIPGGTATATLTKAELDPDVSGFALLEVRINDNAAHLRIRDGQWTATDATGTAASISIAGDGPKLLAILEPKLLSLLPAEIGTAIRMYSDAIVSATATDVSVRLTDDGAVAKLPFLDLNGSLTFTDDGKQYTCKHASIQVYGAQVDGSADAQTITADRARIEGRFESVGGRTIRGKLIMTTGAAKLTHGAAGSGLVAKDLRARGWLDVGAGEKAQESDHQLKDFDDTVETATKNAPALRSLQLDFHAPLTPGTYGTKLGIFGKAQRVRVSPGAALDLHVGVDDGIVTTLVANITGDVSAVFGNKIHRLAFENQRLDADITGWLEPLVDAILALGNAVSPKSGVRFDVAALVTYLAGQYRPFIVDDVNDKDGANWADDDRLERDAKAADLEKRKAEWDADSKHEAVDEPKTYGAIVKDLLNPHAVTGTLDARIARTEAVGRKGADALNGNAQIHGSFVGGHLRLDADATVDTGNGTAKANGVSSGNVAVSDTSAGGTMVKFDSFHVEELSWDPAASAKAKPK